MRKTRALGVACVATAVALLASAVAVATIRLPAAGTSTQVKAAVAASTSITKLTSTLSKELAGAAADNPGKLYPQTYNGCTTLTHCVFGDKKAAANATVGIMGDSHAQMWIPALNRIGTSKHLKIILLYLPQCPAADLAVWSTYKNTAYPQCSASRTNWIAELNALHPKAILLTERTYGIYSLASSGTQTFTDAQWTAGLEATITDLKPSKAKIAVIGDIQTFNTSPPVCLSAYASAVQSCAVPNPNTTKVNHAGAEQAAAKAEGVLFVNPVPWLCTTKSCSPVIGTFIAYYDQFHISCMYAAYLSGVLSTALKSVL